MRSVLSLVMTLLCGVVLAQTHVRAVHQSGQTFVTWTDAVPTDLTYEIYQSDSFMTTTMQGTRVGRVFVDEAMGQVMLGGSRQMRGQDAYWTIPDPATVGTHTLEPDEKLFVNTVRASSPHKFYAVVKAGQLLVPIGQCAPSVEEIYDPVNQPVTAHKQYEFHDGAYRVQCWATWRMGDSDANNHRPDFPVTANRAKNGIPFIFLICSPWNGPGTGPYPMSLGLHGGEGAFWPFRPGQSPNIGTDITEGLVIVPVDDMVTNSQGQQVHATSRWFGFAENADPFFPLSLNPPTGSIVRNYTQKMLDWLIAWLQKPSTGYNIDPHKISMFGHSEGARGAGMYARYRPTVISAVHMFCPADATQDPRQNRWYGDATQNLETNLKVNGVPVGIFTAFDWNAPLNDQVRDWPFTKIYCGKMEAFPEIGLVWDLHKVNLYYQREDLWMGTHLFWDSRDHGINEWDEDFQGNTWWDVGEWITLGGVGRTDKATVTELRRFRSNQSYPAFNEADFDPNTPGIQPELGNGDPFDGATAGTWSGFCDWDENSILDTPKYWSCKVWLTGLASKAVDNCPASTLTTRFTLRRPQKFKVKPGVQVAWRVRDVATNTVLQSGTVTATLGSGLVSIPGIEIARDPARRRIELAIPPGTLH